MDVTKHVFCHLVLNGNIQNYLSDPLDQVAQHYQYHQSLQGYLWLLEGQETPNQAIPSALVPQEVLGPQGILYHLAVLLHNCPKRKKLLIRNNKTWFISSLWLLKATLENYLEKLLFHNQVTTWMMIVVLKSFVGFFSSQSHNIGTQYM